MPRILVAECLQEISSFNPVPSGYDLFVVHRGAEMLDTQRGLNTFVAGALDVFEATPGVEVVPTYSARSFSAGELSREGFERLSVSYSTRCGRTRRGLTLSTSRSTARWVQTATRIPRATCSRSAARSSGRRSRS